MGIIWNGNNDRDNGHVTVMLTMLARDNTRVSELLALLIVGKYYYVNCVKFMTYRELY